MGRSVDYLSYAQHVAYFELPGHVQDTWDWEELIEDIQQLIQQRMPSMVPEDKLWDGRETRVLATNRIARIGISEYCGLCSLSVGVRPDVDLVELGEHWSDQVSHHIDAIAEAVGQRLVRQGIMSNGVGVYQRA